VIRRFLSSGKTASPEGPADVALQTVAQILANAVRCTGIVTRLGDEFALLLPDTAAAYLRN